MAPALTCLTRERGRKDARATGDGRKHGWVGILGSEESGASQRSLLDLGKVRGTPAGGRSRSNFFSRLKGRKAFSKESPRPSGHFWLWELCECQAADSQPRAQVAPGRAEERRGTLESPRARGKAEEGRTDRSVCPESGKHWLSAGDAGLS